MPFWKTEFSVMHVNKYVSNFSFSTFETNQRKLENLAQRKAVKYVKDLKVLSCGREVGNFEDSQDKQAQRSCVCCTAVPNKNISSHFPDLIQHHKTFFSFAAFLCSILSLSQMKRDISQLWQLSWFVYPPPPLHSQIWISTMSLTLFGSFWASKIPWLQNPRQEPLGQGGAAEDTEDRRGKGKKQG